MFITVRNDKSHKNKTFLKVTLVFIFCLFILLLLFCKKEY